MKSSVLWLDQIKDRDGNPICIFDLSFSPDGNCLMVAADNKIYVYDINDGSLVQTLKGHKDTVLSIAFSHDGKRFASGSADKQVIIWTSKMEGILKYSHNDSVRYLQYNPKSHQLLSCTSSDFGLWSPEQKTVAKNKILNQINCCAWSEDGSCFALGLSSGLITIRMKNGEEKFRIDRNGAIWGLRFYKYKDSEIFAVGDWSKTISFYDCEGKQVLQEKSLSYDPLFVTMFSSDSYLIVGGTNKKTSLYTIEGVYLDTLAIQNTWIWSCDTYKNKFAIGCQDGSLAVYNVSFMTVHSLYKERYAYRDSMTDVVIQHLVTGEKVRIKGRDFVKKIAIYETTLAIQLPERVILYESDRNSSTDNMNYKVKEKINTQVNCSLLVLCSSNLILCQEMRLHSLSFAGQMEREWLFESSIRYIKTVGGVPKQEGLLVGLKNGHVLLIFLSNIFPITILKLQNSIRCIDLSIKRQKIAIIDDKNKCFVYEVLSKKLLYEENNVTSIAWNTKYEDLLCISGPGFMGIKTPQFPLQLVNNEFSNKTFVIGYTGSKIFTLQSNIIVTHEISYSKLLLQYIEKGETDKAYQIACLNVTVEDWKTLASFALNKIDLKIAHMCFSKLKDWHHLELIQSNITMMNNLNDQDKTIFLAKLYSYQGLFSEAAKLYKKINQEVLAFDMFNDLQMYEQAKDYVDTRPEEQKEPQLTSGYVELDKNWSNSNLNDIHTMSKLYISSGEYNKALQLIAKADIDSIMSFVNHLNKGETKILTLIANYLMEHKNYKYAIEVYRKMGDYKNLAQVYIKCGQWDEAFQIASDFSQFKQDIYLPYALWLAENERFIEAQQAFYEAGQMDKSYDVLNRLLSNSINENRFHDSSYYSWLLANYFNQLNYIWKNENADSVIQHETFSFDPLDYSYESKAQTLYRDADIYYAYEQIYKYIQEPFTSVNIDILFNSALYLFHFIDSDLPRKVSKVYILFALTKLGKSLGHYKLARIAYKRLQTLKLPDKLAELIEIGSIEIRTKPFVDAEDLTLFCYRCSATSSLFNSKNNQCVNCHQPFNQSFYSFDILPLVEFELDSQLSHDEVERLFLERYSEQSSLQTEAQTPANNDDNWSGKVEQNSQMFEFFSVDKDEERVNALSLSDQINEQTNLVVFKASHLKKLDPAQVVVTKCRVAGTVRYRYYLNMMPEISIVTCNQCSKFFYSDEYEFQLLKNGRCLFCRTSATQHLVKAQEV